MVIASQNLRIVKERGNFKPRDLKFNDRQQGMGFLRLFVANQNPGDALNRVFVYEQPFYSIFQRRCRKIIFGEKPDDLANAGSISQRIWGQHKTYLQRLENFPLKKAAYYRQVQESTGIKSVRGLSEITGEDWSYIAKVLKTLDLPAPIQEFLNSLQEPSIVKAFHLRILLELIQLGEESSQLIRFRELVEETQAECLASLSPILK